MHIEEPMQKAVSRFDWPAVEKKLLEIDPAELRDRAENFIDVILRDGYLILQRPDAKKQKRRDAFVASLRSFLDGRGLRDLLDDRADQIAGQALTETAYFALLSTVNEKLLARLSPAELIWAALRLPEKSFKKLWARMLEAPRDPDVLFDPVSAKLPVDQGGSLAHPDTILQVLQGTLTATLKMLAYGNDWWRDGALILPAPVPTTEDYDLIANGKVYLASIWSQVEQSERRCRYFGGTITREVMQLQEIDGTIRSGDSIVFSPKDSMELELQIAGERLRRMVFGFGVELQRDASLAAVVVGTPPVASAPAGYVSMDEILGQVTLSHLFHKPVPEISQEFGGLTLPQWLLAVTP